MPLTLLVPDLLPPADAPPAMRGVRLRELERWLVRADARREPGTGSAWLLRQWGLGPDAPVAALTIAAEGGPRDGSWLRADPVHQRVDRNALVLHDASVLELTREEVDAAIDALNDHFFADGLLFAAPALDRWYALVPDGEVPTATPLADAIGRNPFGMLPAGRGTLKWPSIFSEAQMLLAALPFNQRRESEGRPQLNGLWFWGGGSLPPNLPRAFDQVAAADPLARSLALASGCPVRALPATLSDLPASPANACLAVLDAMQAPLRRGDADAWIAAARQLEGDWFANLRDSLHRFERIRLVLPAAGDTAIFDIDRNARWRFFRRSLPVAAHA
jgi:hypothetical protein